MSNRANRFGIGLLTTVAAALAGTTGRDASAHQPLEPSDVTLSNIQLAGPACPPSTTTVFLAEDKKSFVIVYNNFFVSAGPGIPDSDSTKQCVAILTVNYPSGWTYAVSSVASSGNALLDPNVFGRMRTRTRYPGGPSVSADSVVAGPTPPGGQDFEVLQNVDHLVYLPCGRQLPLTITLTATVDNLLNRTRGGTVRVEDQSGEFMTEFNLVWKPCSAADL